MRGWTWVCVTAVLLMAGVTNAQAIPDFAPDTNTSWFPDRPAGDDFLPPPGGGPGPVMSDPARPYIPNGSGQPTYRVADLNNPNLQPWVVEELKKKNAEVLAGGIPFSARERCWPGGVPEFDIYRRVAPIYIFQTPKEVLMIWETDQQVRHVYLDAPHSANVKPSWYGESVGHYEGDELVVDTIGLNDKSFVDNYNTPHTTQLHVIERFKIIEGGKTLEVSITADDPGAFNRPWKAVQRFKRWLEGPILESFCAENNFDFLGYKVQPIPQAGRPDF
jgi:hypothetical protein